MSTPPTLQLAAPAPRVRILGRMLPLDGAGAVALAGLLVLLGFATGSGVVEGSGQHLGTNTWMEIVLTLLGAGALVAVLLWSSRGAAHGALALLAFAAMTTLTAVSIAWSVQPDASWTAANQSVAYLGAFGGAIALARLFPKRWPALCGALPLLAVAISGYALLAKVFPALPDSESQLGRVTAPLGYWNAIGLVAAFGLPGCLWLGSRPGYPRSLRAATIPAIALLVTTIVLSYSRSADAAAIVSVALLLALAPTRLRMAVVLLPGLAAGAILSARALSSNTLSDNISNGLLDGNAHPFAARTAAGHSFGWFMLALLVLTSLAAYALVVKSDQTRLSPLGRRRVAIGLLCLAACVPLGAIAKLATSQRGLTGEISHVWSTLTSQKASIGTGPSRITTLANSRPRYWHDALDVGSHHLLLGAGALGFGTARTRYTNYQYPVQTAHGYIFQTFADFGLVGLALGLVLLFAWWRAAWRTIGRAADPGDGDERNGLLVLLAVVVCFGVHSTIDWTWFIPATAIPALICAGWLAGRGPLSAPIGRIGKRRQILSHPALPLSLTAVVVVAVGLAWGILQPLRSVQAVNAAVTAAARGDEPQAFADARAATSRDPFSINAMSALAALYESAGELRQAHAELVIETQRQPQDFESWYDLGDYDLRHGRIADALNDLSRAAHLNPFHVPTNTDLAAAGARRAAAAARRAKPVPSTVRP